VSKKSASISVKISSSAVTTPADSKEPKRLKWPKVPKCGVSAIVDGHFGTFRPQPPVGLSTIEPKWPMLSTMIARIVVAMIASRIAPRTRLTHSVMTRARPMAKTMTGQPWR